MCLMYSAGAQNLASRNLQADQADPDNLAEVAYGPQLATPVPHAGGQDDVRSKGTPSNYKRKIHNNIMAAQAVDREFVDI